MSSDIKIKKGLDIKLKGAAEKAKENAIVSNFYSIRPEDFHSVIPKLIAKVGTKVKAGEAVFFDKSNENIKFVSPVSGEVIDIPRGEKRRILAVKIQADKEQSFVEHGKFDVGSADANAIKSHLLAAGCWPFIKQRPYDVIADPEKSPKAIFISGYASAPLAADLDFTLEGKENEIQVAIDALGKLTEGQVHIGVGKGGNSPLAGMSGATIHQVHGPHPSGNVGTLINKVDPINKGEMVWTVNAQDLVIIGELLLTGRFNAERIVALTGSSVKVSTIKGPWALGSPISIALWISWEAQSKSSSFSAWRTQSASPCLISCPTSTGSCRPTRWFIGASGSLRPPPSSTIATPIKRASIALTAPVEIAGTARMIGAVSIPKLCL